ncbi:MAG TPA: methyltransferase domain-containing protein [Gaiellaceae bacterium]|nr:methyltransferase domain-containing protein [Gaiellaceae bacterium]
MTIDPEIRAHYELGVELDRFERGPSRIEYVRTKELLSRHLPPAPARVLDVGGGPGAYATWLADRGYDVRLVDAVPLHVEHARERAAGRFAAVEGDARALDETDEAYDAVLLLGPLYHLTDRGDRLRALREARRVLKGRGVLAAAGISRFASLLDGLLHGHLRDEVGRAVVARDLATGVHRSPPDRPALFTTAYFHRPEELRAEVEQAGLTVEDVFGVEGPGWLVGDRVDDALVREDVVTVARAIEREPTVVGASGHLLVIAHRT